MLKEYVKTNTKSKVNFESIVPFFTNLNIDNSNDYSLLRDTLRKKFSGTVTKLSDPINNLVIDNLVSLSNKEAANSLVNSSFEILNKEYNEIYKTIKVNKGTLVSELIQYFDKNVKLISKAVPPEAKPTEIIEEEPINPQNTDINPPGFFSFSHFSFWTLLPLLVCLALLLLLMKMVLKLGDRIERRKEEIEKLNYSKPVGNSQNGSSQISLRDIEKMVINSDTIQRLCQEIEDLKKSLEVKKSDNVNFVTPVTQYTKQATPTNETFYMAGPVNNYFPNTAKSQTKENTVYKFIVKPNSQEANYEIHTLGAPINEILSMVESYIKPACDEENIPSGSVKNITTKKQGSAILEGDKWMIKTKAVIRYE